MRKRTLLSNIKVLLTLILAAAFPATIREAKAAAGTTFKVKVTDGYLALRSEKAFDKGNEIGQLNTGDLVEVTNRKDATLLRNNSDSEELGSEWLHTDHRGRKGSSWKQCLFLSGGSWNRTAYLP